MFGILFNDNKDLRRILNDYGFIGFPFRKDFPLYGFYEKSFSLATNSINEDTIALVQEFRFEEKDYTGFFI